MIFMLLMAGAVVNVALCVIAGGVVFVGTVFFLIGLPASKFSKKWLSPDQIKFTLTVFLTLLTLIIYMMITYWSARTGGRLAFSRSVPINVYMDQAKNLILFGAVQGAFSILAFTWLLPGLIGELGLGKKHIWGVSAGVIVTIAGGSVAWLASMEPLVISLTLVILNRPDLKRKVDMYDIPQRLSRTRNGELVF